MGSFYSTCSISNVSICEGDDMVWLFLVPSCSRTHNKSKMFSHIDEDERKNPNHKKIELGDVDYLFHVYEKGLFVSNDGSTGLFSPFGFPIFGKYNDYGQIYISDEDKKNPNIKILEEFFNLDIDTLMNASSDDRWDKYSGDKSWALKTLDGDEVKNLDVLRNLTNTHFSRPVYDSIIEYTKEGGYWFNPDEKVNTLCSILKEMSRYSSKDEIYDDIFNLKEKIKNNNLTKEEEEDVYQEIMNKNKLLFGDPFEYKTFIPSLCSFNFYKLMPINTTFKDDIKKLMCLQYGLTMAYILLRPSNYGSQESNFDIIKHINTATNVVIDKHKGDEDEDE